MTWRELEFDPPPRKLREFAVITGVVTTAWAVVLARRHGIAFPQLCLLGVGAAVFLVGLGVPQALRLVYVGLMIVTFPVSWVVNRIALALVYYGVLLPLGLFFRARGRDPLRLRPRPGASHWQPVARRDTASYFRQH